MVVKKLNSEICANLLNPEIVSVGAQVQILAKQRMECHSRLVKVPLFSLGILTFSAAGLVRAPLHQAAGHALFGSCDIRNTGFGVWATFFVGMGEEVTLGVLGVVFLHHT